MPQGCCTNFKQGFWSCVVWVVFDIRFYGVYDLWQFLTGILPTWNHYMVQYPSGSERQSSKVETSRDREGGGTRYVRTNWAVIFCKWPKFCAWLPVCVESYLGSISAFQHANVTLPPVNIASFIDCQCLKPHANKIQMARRSPPSTCGATSANSANASGTPGASCTPPPRPVVGVNFH